MHVLSALSWQCTSAERTSWIVCPPGVRLPKAWAVSTAGIRRGLSRPADLAQYRQILASVQRDLGFPRNVRSMRPPPKLARLSNLKLFCLTWSTVALADSMRWPRASSDSYQCAA